MRNFARWFVVLALSLSIGLHWAFLQSAAWLNMAVSYAQDASISQAIGKTFDGSHPCAVCKRIQKGQDSDKKGGFIHIEKKIDLYCETIPSLITPPMDVWERAVSVSNVTNGPREPAVPPPREV